MEEADLLEILHSPVEQGVDLKVLDHRAAEDVVLRLVLELLGDGRGDRRPRHQRHLVLLVQVHEGKHVARADGADDHRYLVLGDEAGHQLHRALRVRLVVVHDQIDGLALVAALRVVLFHGELDPLQVRLAEVDDGGRARQALHHADLHLGPRRERRERHGEPEHSRHQSRPALHGLLRDVAGARGRPRVLDQCTCRSWPFQNRQRIAFLSIFP